MTATPKDLQDEVGRLREENRTFKMHLNFAQGWIHAKYCTRERCFSYCEELDRVLGKTPPESASEVERLREALKRIAEMDKLTLLCDPADYDFNAEDAYSAGATNAFCEAADVAREALQTPPESADETWYTCTHGERETECGICTAPMVAESLLATHNAIWPETKHISPDDAKFLRDAQKPQACEHQFVQKLEGYKTTCLSCNTVWWDAPNSPQEPKEGERDG